MLTVTRIAYAVAVGVLAIAPVTTSANEIEQEVAQCRKACFKANCSPAYSACKASGKSDAQCKNARTACERKCITVACAT